MSIRELPEIRAFELPSGVEWELPEEAVARWDESIVAASGDENNVITIFGVIGRSFLEERDNSERRISAALRSIGNKDVVVHINSPGGDFLAGLAIYNLLRAHPARVTVKIMGLAGSAASLITMAGDDILVPKAGFIMVHDAATVAIGNRHELKGVEDILTEIDASMADVYAARAGVKPAKAAAWMDKDSGKGTLFRGQAAVDAGLATGLLGEDQVKTEASADLGPVKAVQRIERALAAQGLSRDERRSLIGDVRGQQAVAAGDRHAVAGAFTLQDLQAVLPTYRS